MNNDDTRCASLEDEIIKSEKERDRLLRAAGIPVNLRGRNITIFIFHYEEGGYEIMGIIETTIQSAHYTGREIELVLPSGLYTHDLRVPSVKRNIREANTQWFVVVENPHVLRNNRMLMSAIREFGSFLINKKPSNPNDWKEDMENRIEAMCELEELEELGLEDDFLQELADSQGTRFIQEISSCSKDRIHNDCGKCFPAYVRFS